MNPANSLFAAIESHEFSAAVNLASDFKTFLRILNSEQPVQDLSAQMTDPEVRAAVFQRALALVKDQSPAGIEHPWDSALAVYLSLLQGADPKLAGIAANAVAQTASCWWARKMAERILSPVIPPARVESFGASSAGASGTPYPGRLQHKDGAA
jgi:hypothetical protein